MYKLYNDDCFNVMKTLEDNSVDMIFTDPPYDIPSINGGGSINNIKKLNKSLDDLKKENADITKSFDIVTFGKEAIRIMKSINIYFWCNKKQIVDYFNFWVNEIGCKYEIITWHKTNALPTYSNKYLSDTEYLLYFHKGVGKTFPQSYEDAKTFYIAPINHKDKKQWKHPTIKPLDITEKIIRNSSKENDIILDCFMGSGTCGVACRNLNRNFIGVELNKEYFEIAKNRIEEENKFITQIKEMKMDETEIENILLKKDNIFDMF